MSAEDWDKETEPFKKNSTKNEWIGCIGSEPIYRGYSCGLWTLFHYLLSEAHQRHLRPRIIPNQIKNYVIEIFSCRSCSDNFKLEVQEFPIGKVYLTEFSTM